MKYLSYRFSLPVVVLSCVVSCFGCDSARTPSDAFPKVALSSGRHDIRILTINVWSGLTYRGTLQIGRYTDNPQKRYALLLAGIRGLDPDIIAIQEANPLPQYAKRLAADLGIISS